MKHANCPACGRKVSLKKDGAFRHHTNGHPEWPGSPWKRVCEMSGRTPA
jgi:hypothetical protein